eukprot:SAG31_NODE_1075_length_10048_cov_21.627701_9_plen_95_part_00
MHGLLAGAACAFIISASLCSFLCSFQLALKHAWVQKNDGGSPSLMQVGQESVPAGSWHPSVLHGLHALADIAGRNGEERTGRTRGGGLAAGGVR